MLKNWIQINFDLSKPILGNTSINASETVG